MAKEILVSEAVARPAGIMSQGVAVPGGADGVRVGPGGPGRGRATGGPGRHPRPDPQDVLENLQAVLAEGGATMDDVVKVTVFVTNLAEHFSAIHEVRSEFFSVGVSGQHAGGNQPAGRPRHAHRDRSGGGRPVGRQAPA